MARKNKEQNGEQIVRDGLKRFLHEKFNLDEDKAGEEEVKENIRKGVDFQGTNLWVLVFATFVASLGLNVNSTAVIIGAMLISPLMGPIMGIGLSVGINDFELMKRSLRNFGFMVLVALLTATVYFLISPLSNATSELFARTQPTIYDVMIAFFGGLAGIVAQSRKDRTSTVIPGVAIATALMPPLCTAGYGLATFQLRFLFGALYLFFINAVFIAIATFIVIRFLKYSKKVFLDPARERKVKRYIMLVSIVTLLPSVVIGYNLVKKSVFEATAEKYVQEVLKFSNTQVIDYSTKINRDRTSTIEVVLVGETVTGDVLENVRYQLVNYGLDNTSLVVHQSGDGGSVDFTSLQAGYSDLLGEKNKRISELEGMIASGHADGVQSQDVTVELSMLEPSVEQAYIARSLVYDSEGAVLDTMVVCIVRFRPGDAEVDTGRMERWLKARTKTDNVKLYTDDRL